MKTLIASCMALATLAFLPSTASADNCRPVGHCNACNSPVMAYQVLMGYDSCRRPVYRWVKKAHYHPAPRPQYYHRSKPSVDVHLSFGNPYSRSYNHRSYSNRSYGYSSRYGRSSCNSRSGGFSIRIR